ncbi:MAG TPA: hypothetical protein VF818_07250 [Ktedonobacterales bacterium]
MPRVAAAKGWAMFRYKGFDSACVGGDVTRLESVVNDWMQTQHPRIRMMAQSPRGEHFVVSFVYEVNNDGAQELAHKAAVPEVFEHNLEDTELDPEDMDDTGLPEAELPY